MPHDVYDLMVRVTNFLSVLEADRALDREAYLSGILSGLKLGQARIGASRFPDDRVIDILTDTELPIQDLLYRANDFLPVGFFYTARMFFRPEFRNSQSKEMYGNGIRLGFNYVISLAEALNTGDDWHETLRKTGRHLDWIAKYLANLI